MTFASSRTDFLNPRRLWAFIVGGDLPSASLLVRAVETEASAEAVLTVPEMIRAFRDNGLPVAAIAEIAKVERKTVYHGSTEASMSAGRRRPASRPFTDC